MTGADFAGNRRFVDRSHAFDHFTIGGDHVAGFYENEIADLEVGARNETVALLVAGAGDQLGLRLGTLPPQSVGLRLAAPLGDGFGEIGEQHREPQPKNDLELKFDLAAAGDQVANEDHRREDGHDLEHEHDRIFDQRARIELDER